jgi:hypothetical protein
LPIQECIEKGLPGWQWGGGKCYTYPKGDKAASDVAKKKAIAQALAIGGGKMPDEKSLNSWDSGSAASGLLDYAEGKDGKIQKGKISDYFGVIDGDGSLRTQYHYPVGRMSGGKPQYDPDGLIAGFVAASGSHGAPSKPALAKHFASIMKSNFPDRLTDGMREILGMKKGQNQAYEVSKLIDEAFHPVRDRINKLAEMRRL